MSKKKFTKKTEENKTISSQKTVKSTTVISIIDPEKKVRKNIYYLIFIVSFMLYGNTIPNEFSMDDELVTLDHKIVSKGFSGIPEIFTSRYVQNDQQSYEYRPIVQVTFAIEHQFTGGNPHFSHFINVVLYALTGVLLFQLLSMLFLNFHWILPASITFLFLMHPIHSEVVASLKNRDEILSFFFTLLSIRAALYFVDFQKYKYLIYSLLFFALAMLSKKSALPLIFTLPIILYFFRNLTLKKAILFIAAPIMVLFILKILINSNLETVDRPGLYFENPYYVDKPGLIAKIPMAFYSMGYYIKLLILPYPLLVYYGYSHIEIAEWSNIWTILSALIFIGGGIYCLLNLSKKNILVFGFLYFTINIGAFSNIMPMPGIIAERFAYGASLGFSIIFCYGILKLLKINLEKNASLKIPTPFIYGFLGLFLISNIYIFQRNKDWKDHLSIYSADTIKAPSSAKIHALIGGYCMQTLEKVRTGKMDKKFTQQEYNNYIQLSQKHFNDALEIFPTYVACLNNLGTLYYSYKGEMDSSAHYFKQVLKLDPKHVQANFNLGSYYEIKYSAFQLMSEYFEKENRNDSIVSLSKNDAKKISDYLSSITNYFRVTNLAFTDLSKTFQQFINDSRVSNGQVNTDTYIASINTYWSNLLLKNKIDPSQTIQPGSEFIQAIINSRITDQNEFAMMLQNLVKAKLLNQFEPLIKSNFKSEFSRDMDTSDYSGILNQLKSEQNKAVREMIKLFDQALFAEKMYPPAFQKLSQIYTNLQLWDSLLHLNEKVLESPETSRFTDVYRMMGTSYFYSKKENEGIKYFEMSIAEEQKILKKVEISLKQHSAAGLNISVQKLNQLIFNSKNTIYTLYMNMGAMYDSIGNESKANECLANSQYYKN